MGCDWLAAWATLKGFTRRQIPWPFFSRKLCREAHIVSANLKGGSEDFHGKGGKITENWALTDVNRRYFGIYD